MAQDPARPVFAHLRPEHDDVVEAGPAVRPEAPDGDGRDGGDQGDSRRAQAREAPAAHPRRNPPDQAEVDARREPEQGRPQREPHREEPRARPDRQDGEAVGDAGGAEDREDDRCHGKPP